MDRRANKQTSAHQLKGDLIMRSASIIVAAALSVASINLTPASRAADAKASTPTTTPSVVHTVAKTVGTAVQHVATVSADARIGGPAGLCASQKRKAC